MKFNIVLFFLFFSFSALGQECDCLKNILFLEQKVEANQASYQHQVVEFGRTELYQNHKEEINTLAKGINTKRDCLGLIAKYLHFFRDEHSFIYRENSLNTSKWDQQLTKKVKPTKRSSEGLFGTWYFQDNSFQIEVVSHPTIVGSTVAIMRKDQTKTWKKGQVKIEFFQDQDQQLKCIYWRQDRIPKVYAATWNDSMLHIGRNLHFYRNELVRSNQMPAVSHQLQFRAWSSETNYLRIPSFDLSQKAKIDSLLQANRELIATKKNWIIDLRSNGGGGFDAFQTLLPYVSSTELITQPYQGSVWVSSDNLDYYDRTKYEYTTSKEDSLEEERYVAFLAQYYGKFTPVDNTIDTLVLQPGNPTKVAILFDRFTASSAEGFALMVSKSSKVTTFGENTMGAVSYGDWMPIHLPDLSISVALTTKKMLFPDNEDFESIGIEPDVNLSEFPPNEWVDRVQMCLERGGK